LLKVGLGFSSSGCNLVKGLESLQFIYNQPLLLGEKLNNFLVQKCLGHLLGFRQLTISSPFPKIQGVGNGLSTILIFDSFE